MPCCPDVADKALGTHFTKERTERLKSFIPQWDKSNNYFDLTDLLMPQKSYICDVMDRAKGKGLVLVQLYGKADDERQPFNFKKFV